MTGFLIGAVLAVVLVLAILLRPFWWTSQRPAGSQQAMNAAIYRDQLAKLDQDVAEGTLGPEDFEQARAELQRRALDEVQAEEAPPAAQAPRRTVAALLALVPIAAVALYALVGNPAGLAPGAAAEPAVTRQDVERMVATLAERMEKEPGDGKGWVMLARSYRALGQPVEAEKAFARAGSLIDGDADALATYADVAAANAQGEFAGKPAELIAKALKVDANHPMALWLSGTAALRRGDSDGALRTWTRLAATLPPESEDARTLAGAIAEVRANSGKQVPAVSGAATVAPASAGSAAPASASGARVSGTVELDAALKGKLAATDTLMVIARVPGTRMPVAVLRTSAGQLPMKFSLDDSLSMSPQARLSSATEVEVEARISKTGMAMPEPGDLISTVQTVKVGAGNVVLKVNEVRK